MTREIRLRMTLVAALAGSLALQVQAQVPAQAPRKLDSAEVKEHLDRARAIAGTRWAPAYQFFCVDPRANSNDDPPVEPTKIFDNVYAIGNTGTVAYAITTSDGIILLDSLAANQVDPVLLPGMRKLGLDPAKVKLVIVAHGHADHFGGSPYFQERGAHVAMSAEDWDFIAPKPGSAPKGPAPPKRDIALVEGQPVGLGDVQVMPVLTPGHTPGSMGFIFPVKENGKTYVAAMFGGTMLTATRPTPEQFDQYLSSIAHFRAEAVRAGAEVELQNHPLMDDFAARLAQLQAHKPGAANPFVVGRENYPSFLDVMSECMRAQIGRRMLQ
jgi:metallo-beta-lactamase class B